MWTFEQLWGLNALNFLISMLAENYFIRKVTDIRNLSKYYWLLYLLLALVMSGIASTLTLSEIINNGHFDYGVLMVLFDLVNITATIWLHHLIFPGISKRIIFFLGVISGILYTVLSETYSGIGSWLLDDHAFTFWERTLFHSVHSLLIFVLMWQFYTKFSKTKLVYVVRKVFIYPKFACIVSIIVVIQQMVLVKILQMINLTNYPLHFFISTVGYLSMFGFLLFLSREYFREERLKRSEILLAQQKTYMDHLETVQTDLRRIHHDLKNVATGLYSQVEAGDLDAARDYISKEFLQLDQGLELSLQQHNQLLHVEVLELKTLLMAKILQAEKINVRLTVEVMEPVQHISMEIADLLRCGGILLDNAIEAAAKTEEKAVCLILLKEKETLTFIVKNSVSHSVDLQRIWERGYSTKGADRGLGLANLKEITQRYHHVVLETRVQEQWFNQILIFQE